MPTRIALSAGLRAKEFFTLRPIEEQPPDKRAVSPNKWLGREDWSRFTVKGKGGLCREVRIEPTLAQELLSLKRETHHYSHDRKVLYKIILIKSMVAIGFRVLLRLHPKRHLVGQMDFMGYVIRMHKSA